MLSRLSLFFGKATPFCGVGGFFSFAATSFLSKAVSGALPFFLMNNRLSSSCCETLCRVKVRGATFSMFSNSIACFLRGGCPYAISRWSLVWARVRFAATEFVVLKGELAALGLLLKGILRLAIIGADSGDGRTKTAAINGYMCERGSFACSVRGAESRTTTRLSAGSSKT